jgi:nucleoside 2-deoxyribosyltransferase
MSNKPGVYLAGPDVFELDAVERGKKYSLLAEQRGLKGNYPLDNQIDFNTDPNPSLTIFKLNKKMIEDSDYVVANLNDFRGHEPDSGTVWEVAYAFALGKPVVAYINTADTMVDRIKSKENCSHKEIFILDKDNKIIENFGNPLNLMIQHSVTDFVVGEITVALDRVVELHNLKNLKDKTEEKFSTIIKNKNSLK